MTPSSKTLAILLYLLRNPEGKTKQEIFKRLNLTERSYRTAKEAFVENGIHLTTNKKRQLFLSIRAHISELGFLKSLSEKDIKVIEDSINISSSTKGKYILPKLKNLVNVMNLGFPNLKMSELKKIDSLKDAKKRKKLVRLTNYKSNSPIIKDRLVEVYDIDVAANTIQAYDVEKKGNRHFRIIRAERVQIIEETDWQYEDKHRFEKVDIFRIANNEQVFVSISFNNFGYNFLTETFPKSKNDISPSSTEGRWTLSTLVNKDFKGLANFILQNMEHAEIEIHDNQVLVKKLHSVIQKFSKELESF